MFLPEAHVTSIPGKIPGTCKTEIITLILTKVQFIVHKASSVKFNTGIIYYKIENKNN